MLQNVVKKQGGGGVPQLLEKNKGGVVNDVAGWVDDDRITCSSCKHMVQAMQVVNMPADEFERIRRQNHPANQWMFDIVKIRNKWARVEYMGWQCNGGPRSYTPTDIKHRCDFYKPKATAVEVNVKEWWE